MITAIQFVLVVRQRMDNDNYSSDEDYLPSDSENEIDSESRDFSSFRENENGTNVPRSVVCASYICGQTSINTPGIYV